MSKFTEMWEQILLKVHPLSRKALWLQLSRIITRENDTIYVGIKSSWIESLSFDIPMINSICKQIWRKSFEVKLVPYIDFIDCDGGRNDAGFVYLIFDGREYKIGFTARTTEARLSEIKGHNPYAEIVNEVYSLNGRKLEYLFHDYFKDYRTYREWFKFPEDMEIEKQFVSIANKLSKPVALQSDIHTQDQKMSNMPFDQDTPKAIQQEKNNPTQATDSQLNQLNATKIVVNEMYSIAFPDSNLFVSEGDIAARNKELKTMLDYVEVNKYKILQNLRNLFPCDMYLYCMSVEYKSLQYQSFHYDLMADKLKLLVGLPDKELWDLFLYLINLFVLSYKPVYRPVLMAEMIEHQSTVFMSTIFDDLFLKHIIGTFYYEKTYRRCFFQSKKVDKYSRFHWQRIIGSYMRCVIAYRESNSFIGNYAREYPINHLVDDPEKYPKKFLDTLQEINNTLLNASIFIQDNGLETSMQVFDETGDQKIYKRLDLSCITDPDAYFTELLADYLPAAPTSELSLREQLNAIFKNRNNPNLSDRASKVLEIIQSGTEPVGFEAIRKSRKWKDNPSTGTIKGALDELTIKECISGDRDTGYTIVR